MCIRDVSENFIMTKILWSNLVFVGLRKSYGVAVYYALGGESTTNKCGFQIGCAKKVVDYYSKGSNDIFEFGAIIDECRRCCKLFFENSKAMFGLMECNGMEWYGVA